VDGIIEVAVFNAELRKLHADGIEFFVIHWVRVAHSCDSSQGLRYKQLKGSIPPSIPLESRRGAGAVGNESWLPGG
jgi:hypothetical protein